MMRATNIRLAVLAGCVVWTLMVPRQGFAGQPDGLGSDFGSSSEQDDSSQSAAAADSSRFTLHFQVGLLYRIGGTEIGNHVSRYVWNMDVAGLFGDRRGITWGLGLHITASNEARYGLKMPLRFPLGSSKSAYFQIAPGVYLGGSDWFDLPGYFCEVELGQTNVIAAVISVEVLPGVDHFYTQDWGSPHTVSTPTTININAGAKLGQLPGLVATIITFTLAAIALSDGMY